MKRITVDQCLADMARKGVVTIRVDPTVIDAGEQGGLEVDAVQVHLVIGEKIITNTIEVDRKIQALAPFDLVAGNIGKAIRIIHEELGRAQ